MPNKKISELPASGALTGAELVELVQGGINVQSTAQDIADLGGGGGGTVTSVNGTTNRITSTGGATPVIDIDAAYDATHVNGRPAVGATGVSIAFAVPQTYGTIASPETGNITLSTTGLVAGMVQLLYHNHATTEPTYPAAFKRQGGVYVPAALNRIWMHAESATEISYWITQTI